MSIRRVVEWPNCSARYSGTAVGMGFERRLAVNQVAGWMIDSVGQQGLCGGASGLDGTRATVCDNKKSKRLSIFQNKAMRQVLAASSIYEASVASDADVVEKDQMGGEKPVSVTGSPICETFCGVIMTMTRDANRVSKVKCKNLVE